jgi:mRNA interferase MazF
VEPFATGVVILVRFPFSDPSQTKLRPAVILADPGRGDSILCQVTRDERAIKLDDASFGTGSLRAMSYARPGKLFTASRALTVAQVGRLKPEFRQIIDSVVSLLRILTNRRRHGRIQSPAFAVLPCKCLSTQSRCRCMMSKMNFGSWGPCGVLG